MDSIKLLKPGFRYDINALRAFAVLSVVLYHFKIKGFSVGFIGVDIFFVISGFLMTQIVMKMLDTDSFSYKKFIYSRIARIWPALIGLIIIIASLGAMLLPQEDYLSFSKSAVQALFFISNIEFAQGLGYFTTNIEERWFLHSWSLSVEWQFYCIYPWLIFAIYKVSRLSSFHFLSRFSVRGIVSILLFVFTAFSFFYSVDLTYQDQPKAFFSLSSRAWEMLIGGHVFLLSGSSFAQCFKKHHAFFKCIAIALLISCVFLGRGGKWEPIWPGILALIPVLASALYMLASGDGKFWSFLEANKITQSIGNWSYSIYLWHWPIVIAINMFGLAIVPKPYILLGLLLSLICGYLSFKYIEQSFRHQNGTLKSLIKIFTPYGLALGLVLSVIYLNDLKVPNNVYGDIAKLSFPESYNNSKLQLNQPLKTFTINRDQPKHVLLMGDSHAQHLYPWFVQHIKDASVTFAITVGCPPIPNMNRHDQGWHCDASFKQINQLIEKSAFDIVVISGNWYSIDWDRPGLCAAQFKNCPNAQVFESRAYAVSKMTKFINKLLNNHTQVVLVKPTPYAPISIGHIIKRYQLWGISLPVNYVDQDWKQKNGDRFIDDVLLNIEYRKLFSSIDLRKEFCNDGICNYFDINKEAIFFDDNHFTSNWILNNGKSLFHLNELLRLNP